MGIRRWGKSLAPGKWPSCHSLGWRTLKWIYNLLRLILELFLGLRSWRWQSWEVLESLGKILWNHQLKGQCDWTMCWNMHLHSFFSWWKKNKDRRMQKKSAWCHERSEKFDLRQLHYLWRWLSGKSMLLGRVQGFSYICCWSKIHSEGICSCIGGNSSGLAPWNSWFG